ncbi:Reverse transcriptase [Phytophthora palmivora]|uniref:Reverse transcriptase n=1 Tax=Phytophthora palmivora TaxID=4796 RepID=A0A2P4Y190_9STRA|nr:Reverse transcriptase [Phytophthora palmivora]
MKYDHGAENLPMDAPASTGSPNASAMQVVRADCPHLSDTEWEALQRLSTVIGEAAVASMLRTLPPTEQHGVALGFIMREQRDAVASKPVSPSVTPRAEHLKLHVSSYMGREGETLLRWLVELDIAITARRIVDPLSKVAFAMSCLGGRARSWTYGRRLTDPTYFSTYEAFKEELNLAFEPPQKEFRSRAEFLDLQQGKQDVHAYAQRARYLVSNVVTNPIDEANKVVTFMKGLKDGPVKTYLFREYPSTLEAAITLAMQEEFSMRQAKQHVNVPRPQRPVVKTEGPEPTDLLNADAIGQQRNVQEDGAGELSDKCVGDVFASSNELEALRKGPSEAQELKQLLAGSTTESGDTLSVKTKKQRFEEQSWDSLKSSPFYKILREHKDVFPDEIPAELPQDKGIQHEIDLVPGTKYCVNKTGAGIEIPAQRTNVLCQKSQGGWRIVHAYNKLNDVPVPAQRPIPRKDVIIDSMAKSTIYSALDLRDGFYQILMRESDVPLTAVSTPSGMLWEWLVMPQGLKNAPATFNRCVTHLLRSVREFAPSYFDDVFVHSPAVNGKTDIEMHKVHLRKLLELMRKHKLYANLKKCIFGKSAIPVLGCLVGKNGVRPDPEKVGVINEWPTPSNVKELRQFLGLATYLCKYVENCAGKIRPLSQLLKKEAVWIWTADCQQAFDAVKQGLTEAPILAVADQDRPFHVVCDTSDFAIGCALMQLDHEGRDRVVYYQSHQLKPAERNYPVHDKELLAMKYALAKFRVYLLGNTLFAVYTYHASLRRL